MTEFVQTRRGRHRYGKGGSGFTLIEMMITVVIIGVLAAIAVPSYMQYVENARRSEGREVLLNTAQVLERCYTTHGSYTDANCNNGLPRDSDNGYYRIPTSGNNGVNIASNSYTLVAVPRDAQSDDKCGSLTLQETGAKGMNNADSGVSLDDCW